MTHTYTATEGNWEDILRGPGPVLVDFWAPWCTWCRRLAPTFERLATEYDGRVRFATVNVDEQPGLAERYGVQGIPALKLFCEGETVEEVIGYLPEAALQQRLDEALSNKQACALP